MSLAAGIEEYRAKSGKLPDEEKWFESVRQGLHPDLLATGLKPSRFHYRVIEGNGQLTYSLVCCGRDGKFGTGDDIDAAYVDRLMRSLREAGRTMAAAGMDQGASKGWCLLLLAIAVVVGAGFFVLWKRKGLDQRMQSTQQQDAR